MTTTATTAAATAAAATATTASSAAAEVERLITKTGEAAVGQSRTGSLLFSSGPCELLLSSSWICFFGLFASLFLSSWSLFAWLWYLVAYLHGDLDLDAEDQSPPLPPRGADSSSSSAGRPCVRGLSSFSDALLFSVDLQSTMGYGRAEIQDECPWAVALFFLQCLVAVFVQSTAMTLLCARLSRSDGSGGKASDGRRLVRYPETLRLTRADGPAVEPRFETRRRPTGQDRSRSCEHLDDLVASRAKFSKYVRNPRAPSSHGKIRGSKTKKSRAVVVGGSSEYRLELEFFGAEELVSMSVHAFLLLERISVGSRGNRERRRRRRETRMEIVSTRSLHFREEERSNGVGSPFRSNGRSHYAHTVDRSSPLRPYLLSMMKDKPRRTPAPLPPRRRLPLLLPPPSKFAALSLENLRSEFKVPDLKPISPFRNFLLRDLWANRSCDDARKRPERDPPETPDGEGGKRPPTTKRKGLGRLLPTHLGSSSSVGDHHSVTIGHDDDDDDEEDDDDDDDDDDEDDGDGRGGNDDDNDEEEGEAFRAAVESERMELVFVVEGTEAGSGALVEAWASYGPEDVVPDF